MHRPARGRAITATLAASALLLAACTPDPAPQPDGSATPTADPTPDAAPAMTEADGYWRANTLPPAVAAIDVSAPVAEADGEAAGARVEVIALDSDAENARLTLAWLPPVEGPALGPDALVAKADGVLDRPWGLLVDAASNEALPPLTADGGQADLAAAPDITERDDAPESRASCACSGASGSPSAQVEEPDETRLVFIDFPAPESELVDVRLGEWLPAIRDVPVSSDEPFDGTDAEFAAYQLPFSVSGPATTYGSGATTARRLDLQANARSWSGVVTADRGEERELAIPSDVLFGTDEHELGRAGLGLVDEIAATLSEEAAGETVTIEGHTDDRGSDEHNQALSERRAAAVEAALTDRVDADIAFETVGYGRTMPLAPNVDADGEPIDENRALNRRASFRYSPSATASGTIDAGGDEDRLPDAETVDTAAGALHSVRIAAPPESEVEQASILVDVVDIERVGDRTVVEFGVRADDGEAFGETLTRLTGDGAHFGRSSQGYGSGASAEHISIGDVAAEREHLPVTAGASACLCTEVTPSRTALGPQPVSLFAEYRLPESVDGPLVVRIPAGGQFELPDELAERLVG